ncbi:hypothetical protein L2E82_35659 [Cichorium intybus]|uniref:Uncharacterized protein n=1 Tax=Cichorium intybus TaxID=13427 RepID=A0ACB9BPG2_CICIN|nr:hypothetical protein L2E82_35659 [Cichorium intybus]
MDCLIQVFTDEYHLQTLETLLGACPQLQPTVDIKTVLSQLMERLSSYAASSPEVLPKFLQVEAFAKLSSAIGKVIETQGDMPIVGAITLYGSCVKKLSNTPKLEDSRATKQVVALLSAPLEKYSDIVTSLTLSNYLRVMDHLDNGTNKVMAMVIIQSIMTNHAYLSSADQVEVLFELIKGLIKDLDGDPEDHLDEEDFNEEQNSVSRVIHVLYNDDPEEMLKIICTVRKHIMAGGPKRLPLTIPPLVFSALRLQNQEGDVAGEDDPATPKKIFQLVNQALSYVPAPKLALRPTDVHADLKHMIEAFGGRMNIQTPSLMICVKNGLRMSRPLFINDIVFVNYFWINLEGYFLLFANHFWINLEIYFVFDVL